jgi:hypothetical protein
MRYCRKVRADVMAELTAHFEDGLKDCKTDDEKEQRAEKLISEFGDVKLLGVLLRRAKKRCRPLWRIALARACQTIVILFVCLILYVVWFLTGKPAITTDYVAELNRIVRPSADESLNAAPLYDKAAELYAKLPVDSFDLLRKKYDEVTPEEKKLIEKFIVDNSKALELVIAATQKPYYWRKYSNRKEEFGMMGILLPNLAEFRRLARSLRWRAQLSAEQGRYEDAFSDIKSCYRMGKHLKGNKFLIEQLVGIAIEALAVRTLNDILGRYEMNSAMLATLQKDCEQMVAGEDFVVNFEAEKLCMYDEIQRCFTEDRFGGGHIYPRRLMALSDIGDLTDQASPSFLHATIFEVVSSPKAWPVALKALFTHPNKHQTREMVDRLYVFWDEMARKTPAQIRAENIDLEKQVMEIVKGNILLQILTPALGRISELSHRNKVGVQTTVTILALLRYKKDKASYPENLDGLMSAGYLKQLPIDLYSNKPLAYKRTDDDFTLYSFGADFDDGGAPSKWGEGTDGGDQVFWPVETYQQRQKRKEGSETLRKKR